jgi:superfamily II DNA or RNA helicase
VSADYDAFVASKFAAQPATGIPDAEPTCPHLFAHQADIVRWALRKGRAAWFSATGSGKTICELAAAQQIAEHTGKPTLILTPLAVAAQMVREGERFGIPAVYLREPRSTAERVVITNYERVDKFDANDFGGVILDESSILKSLNGKIRQSVTEKFSQTRFRICATATPSPNAAAELGNQAEFLGVCTRVEMLAEFFARDGSSTSEWELKGHARRKFFEWMTNWAVTLRKPSDLGYSDDGFELPPLTIHTHVVEVDDTDVARAAGLLFSIPATGLSEERAAKRASIDDRVARVAEIVAAEPDEQWLIFCDLNDEGDALEKAIPGAIQVSGSDDNEVKEERLLAFAEARSRVLITKGKIAGLGLNLQTCARIAYAGVNHSFEMFYQSVRRCWRYGQKRAVHVHVVCSSRETRVLESLSRKERESEGLMAAMVATMKDAQLANVRGLTRVVNDYCPTKPMLVPGWVVTRHE